MRYAVCLAIVLALGAQSWAAAPSANKGRRGTYKCATSRPNYSYFVRVPSTYSERNPAGIHVYIHGDGCANTAEPYLDLFSKFFLEPHNLIGIDVEFDDNTNWVDVDGKAAAVMEAVEQTIADYKVIRGRGVLSSHCGGANTHCAVIEKYGAGPARSASWPFSHCAAYAPRFDRSAKLAPEMSWFLCASDGEWAGASIGADAVARMQDLMARAAKGECADVYLKPTKGQQHWKVFGSDARWLDDRDLAESSRIFGRSDLAFSGFLYEPDFAESELVPIVKAANALHLGPAAAGLDKLLARKDLASDLRAKAELVKAKLALRVETVLALSRQMSVEDPVLWCWYSKVFTRQLAGHPRETEFRRVVPPTLEQERVASWGFSQFSARAGDWFLPAGMLRPESVNIIRDLRARVGARSSLGRMAGEFLMMQ